MSDPTPRPTGLSFVYGAMIAIGALMATLCGGCTLWWVAISVGAEMRPNPSHYEAGLGWVIAIFALLVGGLPTLGGVVLLREGLKRRGRPTRSLDE